MVDYLALIASDVFATLLVKTGFTGLPKYEIM